IVPEVGGDLDVLVIGLGAQPPVALLAVLLTQGIWIEAEGLAHGPLPLSPARAEPMRRTNLSQLIADHARFASPIDHRQQAAPHCHHLVVVAFDGFTFSPCYRGKATGNLFGKRPSDLRWSVFHIERHFEGAYGDRGSSS